MSFKIHKVDLLFCWRVDITERSVFKSIFLYPWNSEVSLKAKGINLSNGTSDKIFPTVLKLVSS